MCHANKSPTGDFARREPSELLLWARASQRSATFQPPPSGSSARAQQGSVRPDHFFGVTRPNAVPIARANWMSKLSSTNLCPSCKVSNQDFGLARRDPETAGDKVAEWFVRPLLYAVSFKQLARP